MHEMAVTESIIGICLKHAEANDATVIRKVNIVLGELAGIVDQCVTFYWDMLAKDTIAEGAQVEFTRVEVRAVCHDCKGEFRVEEFNMVCPKCSSGNTELIAGREFRVESIEIE